jgi:hypothetical protein
MGTTYRVIYCSCSTDLTLKEQIEWCPWCLCRKCGGKNLPFKTNFNDNNDNNNSMMRNFSFSKDLNLDLIVLTLLCIIPVLSVIYIDDAPYLYVYFLGLIAFGNCINNIFEYFNIII